LLPLSFRRSTRKVDESRHSDRQPEGSPQRRDLSARVERLRRLCDARRLDAGLLTNPLELIEGQSAGFAGQRTVAHAARRREAENLADLVLAVSAFRHSYRFYRLLSEPAIACRFQP
jgi:hypothetical protein